MLGKNLDLFLQENVSFHDVPISFGGGVVYG